MYGGFWKFFGGKNGKLPICTVVFGPFCKQNMKEFTNKRWLRDVKPPYRRVELTLCSSKTSKKHPALLDLFIFLLKPNVSCPPLLNIPLKMESISWFYVTFVTFFD